MAVWTMDVAKKIPLIELDVFTGATTLPTGYRVKQSIRRNSCEIRPRHLRWQYTADPVNLRDYAGCLFAQMVSNLRLKHATAVCKDAWLRAMNSPNAFFLEVSRIESRWASCLKNAPLSLFDFSRPHLITACMKLRRRNPTRNRPSLATYTAHLLGIYFHKNAARGPAYPVVSQALHLW
jgi:hypothetical protein